MTTIPSKRTILFATIGLVAVALTASAAVWYIGLGRKQPVQAVVGFNEQGREAGLNFHMSFLPNEQGENFKINLYDHGCGVAVGDYDGDGHDDIYFVNQLGPNGLFRNKGDGTFENVTDKAGVALGDRICVAAVFADYDNDGRQDLFVTSTRGGNVLFHNNGNGTFTEVTKKAGVSHVGHSQTAVFFDYDNDGSLDLFVTCTARWTLNTLDKSANYYPGPVDLNDLVKSPKEANLLYHNNGNGTFTEVTAKAGVGGKGWGGDVAMFDFNEDGYLDLFVTNMFGSSQLYRNNKDGTFTDVTKEILGPTSFGSIGTKTIDLNSDGNLALLAVDMHSDMWLSPQVQLGMVPPAALKKKYPSLVGPNAMTSPNSKASYNEFVDAIKLRPEDVVFGNTLFKKMPSGKYVEISDKANLETWWPWGIAAGDFDNDGYEDVFLPSGMGYPYDYWPNVLMMNNGNETFTDHAADRGIEPPPDGRFLEELIGGQRAARSSRCAAVADFRGDGRLDIVVNNFNDRPFYFRNEFPRQNYVAFRLTGTRSNLDAIGALVKVYSGKKVMVRQVQAAGGYLSQFSKTLHFGLGDQSSIDRVEIHWPGWSAGQYETIDHPAINTLHLRKEPQK